MMVNRMLIEQAKGMLMYTLDVSAAEAFALLKAKSRSTNTKLDHVVAQLLDDPMKAESGWD